MLNKKKNNKADNKNPQNGKETIVTRNYITEDVLELIYCNLRQEVAESKRIRNRFLTLKYAFLAGVIILLAADLNSSIEIPFAFTIVAIAILYIDLMLNQRSIAVKRVGDYLRLHLEPLMFPKKPHTIITMTWEDFLYKYNNKKIGCISRMLIGNILLTFGCLAAAFIFDILPNVPTFHAIMLGLILAGVFVFDFWANIRSIILYS